MANQRNDSAATAEELSRRLLQLERENRRLRERCEEAELESVELEKRLKTTESTLSFRLGHALIQATKSADGVRALPALLAELRRDSQRRKSRAEDESLLSAAARSSLTRLGRLIPGRRDR